MGVLTLPAVYARETYEEVISDILPLLPLHHQELALYQDTIPLEPDLEFYRTASAAGILRVYTARHGHDLIGYAIYLTRNHPHYKSHRWAVCDIIWIDPDHRNAGIGNGLYDFIERDLRAGGPVVIHTTSKAGHPELGFLLGSRGHALVEMGYSKRIG
jgi:hypothetical protein